MGLTEGATHGQQPTTETHEPGRAAQGAANERAQEQQPVPGDLIGGVRVFAADVLWRDVAGRRAHRQLAGMEFLYVIIWWVARLISLR